MKRIFVYFFGDRTDWRLRMFRLNQIICGLRGHPSWSSAYGPARRCNACLGWDRDPNECSWSYLDRVESRGA